MNSSRTNLNIALYLLLVFASGVAVGAFGYRVYLGTPAVSAGAPVSSVKPSPEEWRKQFMGEMQTRVHLTPEQVVKVNGIMDETRAMFHDSRKRHNQELQAIREEQANRIRAILTDEQKPEYEKFRAEREQRNHAPKR